MKETRYIGKVCTKHPEMMGERYRSNSHCIECSREKAVKWCSMNREKVEICRAAYARKNPGRGTKWKKANPEKVMEVKSAWYAANKSRYSRSCALRRAKKLQATPAWANKFFIAEAYHLAKLREKVCGGVWHVDHIVPLKSKVVCGLHVEHNLRVIPGKENLLKGNRYWPDMPG